MSYAPILLYTTIANAKFGPEEARVLLILLVLMFVGAAAYLYWYVQRRRTRTEAMFKELDAQRARAIAEGRPDA